MAVVDDYRLKLGSSEYVPIMIGGMGVNTSTAELALEASRLGGVGHISDAMVPFVCDKLYGTDFTARKAAANKELDYSSGSVKTSFILEDVYKAQRQYVQDTMSRKQGDGAIHINVMEKLTMANSAETLKARLRGALDGGVDGITLSAGLHTGSFRLMEDNPRFRDAKLGTIVSSLRALKIFLRSAKRTGRMPDYIVVEGPLAGGHLGFGEDWKKYSLQQIVKEVIQYMTENDLDIPIIPAGGIFTGTDAVDFMEMGAGGVQVATRFVVSQESGFPDKAKQEYFLAREKDVIVSKTSPTGYLIRVLASSPSLSSGVKPGCGALGYALSNSGKCQYINAYNEAVADKNGRKTVTEKMCLCYHFGQYNCYTCGHNVYKLKDTTNKLADGSYQLLSAEHVFKDYQFSKDHAISVPEVA